MMFSLTFSDTLSSKKGRLPMRMFSSSPLTPSPSVRFICSAARWGSRSVTQNTGSSADSPTQTGTTSPLCLTMTPCRARGMAVHWYFLMPP